MINYRVYDRRVNIKYCTGDVGWYPRHNIFGIEFGFIVFPTVAVSPVCAMFVPTVGGGHSFTFDRVPISEMITGRL